MTDGWVLHIRGTLFGVAFRRLYVYPVVELECRSLPFRASRGVMKTRAALAHLSSSGSDAWFRVRALSAKVAVPLVHNHHGKPACLLERETPFKQRAFIAWC